MQQYKRLAKNSIIFAVANFGSKILTFILVPYYTYVLTTSEYGMADTLISTLSLILPFITLYIQDAVMRFAMDSKWKKTQVLSVGIIIIFAGSIITLLICFVLYLFGLYKEYIWIIFTLLISDAFYVVIGQYVRGTGKIKQFALGGVVFTVALCTIMPFFLSVLKWRVKGYLLGQTVAYVIGTLYYICCVYKDFKKITFKIKSHLVKDMILYSLPLMPNAVMWWIMNASDRYMLIAMIGISATGIYSVAQKVPSIMNMVTTIFFQAFQISAIEEKESKTRHSFYSKIYNYLCCVLLVGASSIILIIRPILNGILPIDYQEACMYVPFLMLSFVFSSVGAYYGTFYAVSLKTAGALKSTIIGAIVNIVANFCFIPIFEINGAAIGTCIGMMVMCIYRAMDTYKYEQINYKKIQLFALLFGNIGIILLFYWNTIVSIILQIIIFIIEIIAIRKMIYEMFVLLLKNTTNRRKK